MPLENKSSVLKTVEAKGKSQNRMAKRTTPPLNWMNQHALRQSAKSQRLFAQAYNFKTDQSLKAIHHEVVKGNRFKG